MFQVGQNIISDISDKNAWQALLIGTHICRCYLPSRTALTLVD